MRKLILSLALAFVAMHMSASTVTIDATNLKLNEEMAGFPFYILRMEASSNTAAIRIQLNVAAEDYTGSYTIGGDNSAERTVHCVLRGKPQGLEEIVHCPSSIRKFVKDGLIYIQRGEQMYDVTGKKLR